MLCDVFGCTVEPLNSSASGKNSAGLREIAPPVGTVIGGGSGGGGVVGECVSSSDTSVGLRFKIHSEVE